MLKKEYLSPEVETISLQTMRETLTVISSGVSGNNLDPASEPEDNWDDLFD